MKLPNININPVVKRFLKGLVATLIASGIAYALKVLPSLNLLDSAELSVVTGLLLAAEKAIPQNL